MICYITLHFSSYYLTDSGLFFKTDKYFDTYVIICIVHTAYYLPSTSSMSSRCGYFMISLD